MPGTLLCNRYHLESEIAQGATAVVYRAVDVLLDDVVAVKLVSHDGLLATPEAQAAHLALRDEAVLAMHLSHPKILRVFTYERHAPWEFLVMELVTGQDLFAGLSRRRGGRYSIAETTHIGLDCLDALLYAHSAGVIHHDVKPRNILMTRAGAIKICDFGLARIAAMKTLVGGQGRPAIGTPAYMAPERIRGEAGDARSDLYSLAATLWTLATGRAPFGTDDDALLHHLASPLPEAPVLPRALDAVLRVALAKRPADRFPSAAHMRDALSGVLAQLDPEDALPAPAPSPDVDDDIEISIDFDEEPDAAPLVVDRTDMVRVSARVLRSAYGGEFPVALFDVDRTPVTNAQYARFLASTGVASPAHWKGERPPKNKDTHPVVGINLDEARAYAAWAGKRLPTAIEWEAAARGPRQTAYPWGDEWRADLAVCREAGAWDTAPVGRIPEGASAEGLLDAIGNVWEWTEPDPRAPAGDMTWVMGGSFRDHCGGGRVPRTAVTTANAYEYLGFRCALSGGGKGA